MQVELMLNFDRLLSTQEPKGRDDPQLLPKGSDPPWQHFKIMKYYILQSHDIPGYV